MASAAAAHPRPLPSPVLHWASRISPGPRSQLELLAVGCVGVTGAGTGRKPDTDIPSSRTPGETSTRPNSSAPIRDNSTAVSQFRSEVWLRVMVVKSP